MKIRLPTGGTLAVPTDPTQDVPSDCSRVFSFLPIVASYLASTECLLKVLTLVGPLVSVVRALDQNPELAASAIKFLKAAEALPPCELASTHLGVLPFVRDVLCVVIQALNCIIGQLKTLVGIMTGLIIRLKAAQSDGNLELVKQIEAALKNAGIGAVGLFDSVESIQTVLGLAGSHFGIAGLPPAHLPPPPVTTDINALTELLRGLESSATSLQIAADGLGGCGGEV
jgi:hypothetical protein